MQREEVQSEQNVSAASLLVALVEQIKKEVRSEVATELFGALGATFQGVSNGNGHAQTNGNGHAPLRAKKPAKEGKRTRSSMDPEVRAKILEMHNAGTSTHQIAKAVGMSWPRVNKTIQAPG